MLGPGGFEDIVFSEEARKESWNDFSDEPIARDQDRAEGFRKGLPNS